MAIAGGVRGEGSSADWAEGGTPVVEVKVSLDRVGILQVVAKTERVALWVAEGKGAVEGGRGWTRWRGAWVFGGGARADDDHLVVFRVGGLR